MALEFSHAVLNYMVVKKKPKRLEITKHKEKEQKISCG